MITASVVLYKTPVKLTETIVKSFAPTEVNDHERKLYIVDNEPSHGHDNDFYEFRPNVYIIHNGKNLGYGAGHNIAIKDAIKSGSKYHVVLNPDLKFSPDVIDSLASYADKHEDIVYMLPKIVSPNGEIQHLCKLLPTPLDLIFRRFLPFLSSAEEENNRYTLLDSGYDHIINPPCLSGCFMFMRTETLRKNNLLFDERFFMYCEDFDLIRRLHRIGRTIYYPYVTVTHAHERSSYHSLKALCHHMTSAIKYFNKYGWFSDEERDQMNEKILDEITNVTKEEIFK